MNILNSISKLFLDILSTILSAISMFFAFISTDNVKEIDFSDYQQNNKSDDIIDKNIFIKVKYDQLSEFEDTFTKYFFNMVSPINTEEEKQEIEVHFNKYMRDYIMLSNLVSIYINDEKDVLIRKLEIFHYFLKYSSDTTIECFKCMDRFRDKNMFHHYYLTRLQKYVAKSILILDRDIYLPKNKNISCALKTLSDYYNTLQKVIKKRIAETGRSVENFNEIDFYVEFYPCLIGKILPNSYDEFLKIFLKMFYKKTGFDPTMNNSETSKKLTSMIDLNFIKCFKLVLHLRNLTREFLLCDIPKLKNSSSEFCRQYVEEVKLIMPLMQSIDSKSFDLKSFDDESKFAEEICRFLKKMSEALKQKIGLEIVVLLEFLNDLKETKQSYDALFKAAEDIASYYELFQKDDIFSLEFEQFIDKKTKMLEYNSNELCSLNIDSFKKEEDNFKNLFLSYNSSEIPFSNNIKNINGYIDECCQCMQLFVSAYDIIGISSHNIDSDAACTSIFKILDEITIIKNNASGIISNFNSKNHSLQEMIVFQSNASFLVLFCDEFLKFYQELINSKGA